MEDAQTRVGSRFGPYELRSLLGRGGMGEVYEAYDTGKGRVIALKLLPTDLATDPVFQQRFRYESKAAARLAEPHVIPIHDWGEIDGVLYIDMRLVRGSDLRSVLRETGALSPIRAVAIIEQIAAALDAAHSEGLVHRDVKPANILVTPSDFAYLADFGIARSTGDPNMTDTGTAVGSYNYIAPERFDTAPISGTADVYSLTCVLYECLTGAQPFPTGVMSVLIRSHLTAPPPRPSAKRSGLPPALDGVIARGMAKEPADRYPTASALASAARAALTVPPPVPDPVGRDRYGSPPAAPSTIIFPAVESGQGGAEQRPAVADPTTRRIASAPDTRQRSRPNPVPGTSPPRRPGAGHSGPGPSTAGPPGFVGPDPRSVPPTVDLGAVPGNSGPAAVPPPGRTGPAGGPNPRFGATGPPAPGENSRPGGPGRRAPDAEGGIAGAAATTTGLEAVAENSAPGRPPRKTAQARISHPAPGRQGEHSGPAALFTGPTTQFARMPDDAATMRRMTSTPSAPAALPPVPAAPVPARPRISPRRYWLLALLVLAVVVAGIVGWQVRAAHLAAPPETPSGLVKLPDGARICGQSHPRTGRITASATGTAVTSCPFAEAVRKAYGAAANDGDQRDVTATSPVNGREYTMDCTAGADFVTCVGGENAVVYLY